MILAIDPGNFQSAYVLMNHDFAPLKFGKVPNQDMRNVIQEIETTNALRSNREEKITTVIEMISSYGMRVGREVFDTCVWIGRFTELASRTEFVYRKDVKLNLCGRINANDSNVRMALIDRFAIHDYKTGKGTKSNPDWFYGFHSDIWASYAVGCTYLDQRKGDRK